MHAFTGHGAPETSESERGLEADAATDATLASAAARGDRAALAGLYDRYAAPAYSLASRLVGTARAEDVVHDAFVAPVDRPDTFDPTRGTFRSWFMTAVHHRCLNLLRTRSRLEGDDELMTVPGVDPEPVDSSSSPSNRERVRSRLR